MRIIPHQRQGICGAVFPEESSSSEIPKLLDTLSELNEFVNLFLRF